MTDDHIPDQTGRIALVTGATGGIGRAIARGLAQRGATVIVGARDLARGEAVAREITLTSPAIAMELDVADQSSIRAFAAALVRRHGRLDLLVNNAGAWFTDRRTSPDGHELTLATNVLGPFLLTSLLEDALLAAPAARVVNVVSSLASSYDPDDLQFTHRRYSGFKAYAQSKQALRMLTFGLAARLAGSRATANAVAPGFVRTDLNRHAKGLLPFFIDLAARFRAVSPDEGAATPLWAALSPALDGVTGRYLADRREVDSAFREPDRIAALEERCRELTGLAAPIPIAIAGGHP